MQKIRIGIDLDHVVRDINRQIVKNYKKEYDDSLDIDEVDLKDDVLNTVCKFRNRRDKESFLYENYPLEIFGHAGQVSRNLSRDLNFWLSYLTNQEQYDVEVFFFSMKEDGITIQSTYFYLSKIGSRVRKMVFPKTAEELYELGDVFITADPELTGKLKDNGKGVVLVKMNFNMDVEKQADWVVEDFREFLDDDNKLTNIANIINKEETCQKKEKGKWSWTSMLSCVSSFLQKRREVLT